MIGEGFEHFFLLFFEIEEVASHTKYEKGENNEDAGNSDEQGCVDFIFFKVIRNQYFYVWN